MASRSRCHVSQHLVDAYQRLYSSIRGILSAVLRRVRRTTRLSFSQISSLSLSNVHTSLAFTDGSMIRIRWLKGRLEKSQASEAVSAAVGWIKKRVDRKRRRASGKPVNVVPVLRPVTDCRLSDRLCPDQTGEW